MAFLLLPEFTFYRDLQLEYSRKKYKFNIVIMWIRVFLFFYYTYFEGGTPNCSVKCFLKVFVSVNPTSSDTS